MRAETRRQRVRRALDDVPEDLPDGAWMQWLCDATGLDAGEVSEQLRRIAADGPVVSP